jgi:hypothetical protein
MVDGAGLVVAAAAVAAGPGPIVSKSTCPVLSCPVLSRRGPGHWRPRRPRQANSGSRYLPPRTRRGAKGGMGTPSAL